MKHQCEHFMCKLQKTMKTVALATAGVVTVLAAQTASFTHPTHAVPNPVANQGSNAQSAHITNVKWFSDRRVSMWVFSPSMNTNIHVDMLLARDWNTRPHESFPQLLLLDNFQAPASENGWLSNTPLEKFFSDKNVNVILPSGGQSSFYTNWKQPDNGVNYQWQTFLTQELDPILRKQWRTSATRGVAGPSMGGTAAVMLAEQVPHFYSFAGSYSGILDITTLGMPLAIQLQQRNAGNFDSSHMFGPANDPAWKSHDPTLQASKLRGSSVYVSSGSGGPSDLIKGVQSLSQASTLGVSVLSRITSEKFANTLNQLSIPAQVVYRQAEQQTWNYSFFELQQSWPLIEKSLGASPAQSCSPAGAIGKVFKFVHPGQCVTAEYAVGTNGRAQDFSDGRIFFSPKTGTHYVHGAIGGSYIGVGGPAGVLGLPTSREYAKGQAHIQLFQNGLIVWTPSTGAHAVYGAILHSWVTTGGIHSPVGIPNGDEVSAAGVETNRTQSFTSGSIYYSPGSGAYMVHGAINKAYLAHDAASGLLGLPTSNEIPLQRHGIVQRFIGGNIYCTPKGVYVVNNGPIMDAWASQNFERGRLGYPTSDTTVVPGGSTQKFEHGAIDIINGKINYVAY